MWYNAGMKIHLYYTNPALEWVTEDFRYNLKLINGETLSILFDVNSAATYTFTAQAVEELFGPKVIKDREGILKEHLDQIYDAIADVLNEGMALVTCDIMHQTMLSFLILAGLDSLTKNELYTLTSDLASRLLLYYKQKSPQKWVNWLESIKSYVDARK